MSTSKNRITKTYQPFQLLNNGALSLSGNDIYLRVDRRVLVNTINNPNPIPMTSPMRILLMAIPSSKPITIANIKAISPLRASGFRSCGIVYALLFFMGTIKILFSGSGQSGWPVSGTPPVLRPAVPGKTPILYR